MLNVSKFSSSVAIMSACAAVSLTAAHADYKIQERTTIESPQFKAMSESLSPQQRSHLGKSSMSLLTGAPITSTVFTNGKKVRTDAGPATFIFDPSLKRTYVLNRGTHTYSVAAYNTQAGQMLGATHPVIKDMGRSKSILGHPTHRYHIVASLPGMTGTQVSGDVWAATDLPQIGNSAFNSGPASILESAMRSIKGLPMQLSMTVAGSPLGNVFVHSTVVSVSKTRLAPSVFSIPAGYALRNASPRGLGMGAFGR